MFGDMRFSPDICGAEMGLFHSVIFLLSYTIVQQQLRRF
jgi:hypothetical protein